MKHLFLFVALFSINPITINTENLSHSDEEYKTEVEKYLMDSNMEINMELLGNLREKGYASLDWLRKNYIAIPRNHQHYKNREHALRLYDKVSGQKDAIFSNLFWFKDMKKAKLAAAESKKPILSLRMLGDFSEDLSCANSRFFRILLYSNENVAKRLREDFILHVSSVIQVPKITIEYPDGTVQKQTITGNSMHMIMDSRGNIIDALPGLYGPEYFNKWLVQYKEIEKINLRNPNYFKSQRKIQINRLNQLMKTDKDFVFVDENLSKLIKGFIEPPVLKALDAEMLTVGKMIVEAPILEITTPKRGSILEPSPVIKFNDIEQSWLEKLQGYGFNKELIDDNTRKLIEVKKNYPNVQKLEETLLELNDMLTTENIRNEMNLRINILEWLDNNTPVLSEKEFVEKVYAELFLTPLDDKKMGMYDPSIFYGITNDGF